MTQTEKADRRSAGFRWRSIAAAVFLPTILFSTGEGALLPIIPVVATDLGASLALAGLVASLIMVGELIGDIPSGWIVTRIGERNAMLGGAILALVGVVCAALAREPWLLAAGTFLIGLATAVFALARHAFMTTYVPIHIRARALSLLGGVFRGGWFVGPLLATVVIRITGTGHAVYWVHAAACVAVIIALLALPDPERAVARADPGPTRECADPSEPDPADGLIAGLRRFAEVYLRVGIGSALLMALRSSRVAILPLWALSIGMAEADSTLVIGLANGLDFALFYVSGLVMDRWGRLWAAVPALLGLGVGHLALALTHEAGSRTVWFIVLAIVLGFANGLSSGVNMTLGADLAPRDRPAPFLGGWRFITDAGNAVAPLAISGLTFALSLPAAAAALGAAGLVGAWMLAHWVPRYVRTAERPAPSGTGRSPS